MKIQKTSRIVKRLVCFSVCFGFIILIGCTSLHEKSGVEYGATGDACRTFLRQIDDAVDAAGTRDAAYARIPGFPYFSIDRFWSAYGKEAQENDSFSILINNLYRLNTEARKNEIQNLPIDTIHDCFGADQNRSSLDRKTAQCTKLLFKEFKQRANPKTQQFTSFAVPQEYSSLMRTVGIYPAVSLPVAYLTHKARREFKKWFETPLSKLPIRGEIVTFSPKYRSSDSFSNLRSILIAYRDDPKSIFQLAPDQIKDLAYLMAPKIVQDIAGVFDQFGEVVWNSNRIDIDIRKPTLYYYITYAYMKNVPMLQVNYVLWYEGRRGPDAPWVERGPVDGLTIRVTIDRTGNPVMVDIMNNCGCYHLFAPKDGLVKSIKKKSLAIDAFMPQTLPTSFPDLPLRVRVISGWHQVARLYTQPDTGHDQPYQLLPYQILESLPHKDGRRESIFTDRGIVKGSDRIEPLLLFSMGVPKVGYMRQRGHHAISLVGKDHFDDPYLFEKNFIFQY